MRYTVDLVKKELIIHDYHKDWKKYLVALEKVFVEGKGFSLSHVVSPVSAKWDEASDKWVGSVGSAITTPSATLSVGGNMTYTTGTDSSGYITTTTIK